MEGCFLTKAQTQGGANGDHAHMTIDCTIDFDNATLYDRDGNQIPSADAGIVSDITNAFSF